MAAALEGGEWSAARPGRTLPPGKTLYPFYWRLGRSQDRSGRAENLVSTGIRSRTVQPVVSRYTDWATLPTHRILPVYKIRHILHPSSTNHILVSPSGLCFLITPTILPLSTVSSIASVATYDCTTQYSISWAYWLCKKACWLEPCRWLCCTQKLFIEPVLTFRWWCSLGFRSSAIWRCYQRVIGSWCFKEALHLIFKG